MNAKIYKGNVQPNPKEFKIWVNDEGTIRTWNGTEWVEATAGEGGGSGNGSGTEIKWEYYRIIGDYDNSELIRPAVACSQYAHHIDEYDDFISSDADIVSAITEIACTNIPFIFKSNNVEAIIDKGSWKLNFCEFQDIDEEYFNSTFSPITKDEFFTIEPIKTQLNV